MAEDPADLDAFDQALTDKMNQLKDLLVSKRRSYGASNLTRHGVFGILVRTDDKMERLRHMHEEGLQVTDVGESYTDAWQDVAGYALLALLFLEHGPAMYTDGHLATARAAARQLDTPEPDYRTFPSYALEESQEAGRARDAAHQQSTTTVMPGLIRADFGESDAGVFTSRGDVFSDREEAVEYRAYPGPEGQ
jgi:hypothetical protein